MNFLDLTFQLRTLCLSSTVESFVAAGEGVGVKVVCLCVCVCVSVCVYVCVYVCAEIAVDARCTLLLTTIEFCWSASNGSHPPLSIFSTQK